MANSICAGFHRLLVHYQTAIWSISNSFVRFLSDIRQKDKEFVFSFSRNKVSRISSLSADGHRHFVGAEGFEVPVVLRKPRRSGTSWCVRCKRLYRFEVPCGVHAEGSSDPGVVTMLFRLTKPVRIPSVSKRCLPVRLSSWNYPSERFDLCNFQLLLFIKIKPPAVIAHQQIMSKHQ